MDVEVQRREDAYEITADGAVAGRAFIEVRGRTVVFTHTEIDDAYGGQGLGGRLVQAALDDVRARGEQVIARCPFVKAWVDKHPSYQDLLARSA